MPTDQTEAVAFLSSLTARQGPVAQTPNEQTRVEQTYGAYMVLVGDMAYKIKRAVRYDYIDLSTLTMREAMLRRELGGDWGWGQNSTLRV